MIFKAAFAIFALAALMIGAQLYEVDLEKGITRDIYNYTEEKIDVPQSNISSFYPIERTKGVINIGRFYKILESGINFLYTSAEQLTKMGIEYGYQNPNINWEKISKLVILVLVVWVVVMLIKPIGYILIFIVKIIIMNKEKIKNKRKKNDCLR